MITKNRKKKNKDIHMGNTTDIPITQLEPMQNIYTQSERKCSTKAKHARNFLNESLVCASTTTIKFSETPQVQKWLSDAGLI